MCGHNVIAPQPFGIEGVINWAHGIKRIIVIIHDRGGLVITQERITEGSGEGLILC